MKNISKPLLFCLIAILAICFSIGGQTKNRKTTAKTLVKTPETQPTNSPAAEPTPTKTPTKKNERPDANSDSVNNPPTDQKKNQRQPTETNSKTSQKAFPYKYEFSQPNFVVSHIIIEHDENGVGKITFEKKESSEPISDPIQVSSISLEKIKDILQTLNFLDSTEEYQSPTRDYGHLGNHTITFTKDKKTRTVKYNWTENPTAKLLVAEYHRISEQFIWIFDMNVSLENQPLEAPSLMDRLDSLLQRNEISDPNQMIPKLKELSNDERIPLIARNHAMRIVKSIEKKQEK